ESVLFADGFNYNAIVSQQTPLLTISIPVGLQMGNSSGDITINGSGYSLDRLENFSYQATSNSNLQVKPGKTLGLIGGNITMNSSRVSTNSGDIQLGSVKQGLVDLNLTSTGWKFDYQKVSKFGNIKLDQAMIDGIAPGGGTIDLQAGNIFLHNGSNIVIQNQGFQLSGGININAAESVEVTGLNPQNNLFSDIRTESLLGSTGDISISTQRLTTSGEQGIQSYAFNAPGGNIIIDANESVKLTPFPLNPINTSQIETASFSQAKAGNVVISTGNLTLVDGSRVASVSRSLGDSGNVTINAKSIEVNGIRSDFLASLISAGTLGEGNAGNLLINTDRLTVRNGGRVDSSTAAQGNAGNVTINAQEFIEVSGTVPGSINPSLIISSASLLDESLRQALGLPASPTGESGNLIINTPELRVIDGALVTVNNDGTGNAGSLKINANSIFLNSKGGITAATESGEGGNIELNLQESLFIRGESSINTESLGTGNGGNIDINSPVIGGFENSDIVANAIEGNGGNIDIVTQGIFGLKFREQVTEESDITASSKFGVSGSVKINNIGINPSSGITQLSTDVIDSSNQIASGCATQTGNTFVSTGRGGIAQNPNEQVDANFNWSDIRDLSIYLKRNSNTKVTSISEKPKIIEATGFRRNSSGDIELVASENISLINKQAADCSRIDT
ncbi:MAG: S-layer family protein, partial [Cyanobacteria bacterium J06621_15]